MSKIDRHIETYKTIGFTIEKIDKNYAVFSYKDIIEFHGRTNWYNGFLIENVIGQECLDKLNKRIEFLDLLSYKGLLSDETFRLMLKDLELIYSNKDEAYLAALNEAKSKIHSDLSSESFFKISKLKYILVILPKSTREEFIADLQCIIEDMKNDDCSKIYIWFVVMVHIASVAYHAFFFKLKDYFYSNKKQSDKD